MHIGHFKTGTSALQVFLEENPRFLASHGIEYVEHRRWFCKHSYLAFSIYEAVGITRLMHGYPFKDSPRDVWTAFFDAVRASPEPRLLASTEELMRVGAYPAAQQVLSEVAALGQDIDIRIIAYLRRPQAHLQSWYNQLVKMGEPVLDFDTAVRGVMEEVHFDYAQALKPWIDIFGAEAVIVRPYVESSRGTNALYADFLSVLGIELPEHGLCYPESDPNPRLPQEETNLMRLINSVELPKDTDTWTRKRATGFLEKQNESCIRPILSEQDVADRIDAGLDFLEGLPANSVEVDARWRALPSEGKDEVLREARQLSGFLLAEIQSLRQRMIQENLVLRQRLEALEKTIRQDVPK